MINQAAEQTLMRIFVSEHDKINNHFVYELILKTLRDSNIAGATVIRGIEGFGAKSHLHKTSVIALSQNMPIIIEVIDTNKKIDSVTHGINEIMQENNAGLITFEKVKVIRYDK
jgi:uncharacterized protein